MRYIKTMRVRFGHADPARIVYYPRFFEWFHDAFESMFEDVLHVPYSEVLSTTGVGFPAVMVATEFRRPARFGDLVNIELFLSRLGPKSMTFEYRVRLDKELLASASVKVASMNLRDHRAAPMPQIVRDGFRNYVDADDEIPRLERLRPN